jgi:hypothetical protein
MGHPAGSLGGFGCVLEVYVYGFVASYGGYVGIDIPVEGGWEQLSGQGQELLEISGVVDIAGAELPGGAEAGGETVVDTAEFEFSHVVEKIFVDKQVENHFSGDVIELGVYLDAGEDIAARAVEGLDGAQVFSQLNGVWRLPGLGVEEWFELVAGNFLVARPIPAGELVLQAGSDGKNDFDVGGRLFIFG